MEGCMEEALARAYDRAERAGAVPVLGAREREDKLRRLEESARVWEAFGANILYAANVAFPPPRQPRLMESPVLCLVCPTGAVFWESYF